MQDVLKTNVSPKNQKEIYIIGAGISGLIAANVLEKQGFSPIILEKDVKVGGRVQTDNLQGYSLDKGFQVLLTAYPLAKQYLDYEALDLQHFLPGAIIFGKEGKQYKMGDPLRHSSFLTSIFSRVHFTTSDLLKIAKLKSKLLKKSNEEIFQTDSVTTLAYLQNLGFSKKIINAFFKPFFKGIFLEGELSTSSRMFEFVFKMFSLGTAAIPKNGIQAIPDQLYSKLKHTEVKFNTTVKNIQGDTITLQDDTVLKADAIVIATYPDKILPQFSTQQHLHWYACQTLYFKVDVKSMLSNIIGLLPYDDVLINSLYYPAPDLLSVTVVGSHKLSQEALVSRVIKELNIYCNIEVKDLIGCVRVSNALPALSDLQYNIDPTETRISNVIFLAGDHLLNPSLNAAMMSGQQVALAVVEHLKGD